MIDLTYLLNTALGIVIGTLIVSVLLWKLFSYFTMKSLIAILRNEEIQNHTYTFVERNVVQPFNNLEDDALKHTIKEAIIDAIKKLKKE